MSQINGNEVPIEVGDKFRHDNWGIGTVVFINSSLYSKRPLNIHFKEYAVFGFFDIHGFQYDTQEVPMLHKL